MTAERPKAPFCELRTKGDNHYLIVAGLCISESDGDGYDFETMGLKEMRDQINKAHQAALDRQIERIADIIESSTEQWHGGEVPAETEAMGRKLARKIRALKGPRIIP